MSQPVTDNISRRNITIIALVFSLYVIYHLLSLSYSPLPWFDEVCFASITHDYMQHHTFFDTTHDLSVRVQSIQYGPVYFVLQSLMAKLFGFSIFTFRFTNLFFGITCLFIIYKICIQLNFKPKAIVVT